MTEEEIALKLVIARTDLGVGEYRPGKAWQLEIILALHARLQALETKFKVFEVLNEKP